MKNSNWDFEMYANDVDLKAGILKSKMKSDRTLETDSNLELLETYEEMAAESCSLEELKALHEDFLLALS